MKAFYAHVMTRLHNIVTNGFNDRSDKGLSVALSAWMAVLMLWSGVQFSNLIAALFFECIAWFWAFRAMAKFYQWKRMGE